MKKKYFIISLIFVLFNTIIFSFFSYTQCFTKTENKILNQLIGKYFQNNISSEITLITIDDNAISKLGQNVYDRKFLGDLLILLKQFDTKSIVLTDDYSLKSSTESDKYFGKCLNFNEKVVFPLYSYQLNNIDAQKILQNKSFSEIEDFGYLINLDNQINNKAEKSKIEFQNDDFLQNVYKIGYNTKNLTVDSNKIELFEFSKGNYYPYIGFIPFLNDSLFSGISREKDFLIIKDFTRKNIINKKDLYIPLDNYGCFLVNKADINKFNKISVYDFYLLLTKYNQISNLIQSIQNYENEKQLEITKVFEKDISELNRLLVEIENYKNALLDHSEKQNSKYISAYEYTYLTSLRNSFVDNLTLINNKKISQAILNYYRDNKDDLESNNNPEISKEIQKIIKNFDALSKLSEEYIVLNDQLLTLVNNHFCFIGNYNSYLTTNDDITFPALVLNNFLNEKFIKYLSWYCYFGIIYIISFIFFILNYKYKFLAQMLNFSLIIIYIFTEVISFKLNLIYFPVVLPVAYIIINQIFMFIINKIYTLKISEQIYLKNDILKSKKQFNQRSLIQISENFEELFKNQSKFMTILILKISNISESFNKLNEESKLNTISKLSNEFSKGVRKIIDDNFGQIVNESDFTFIISYSIIDFEKKLTDEQNAFNAIMTSIKIQRFEREFNEIHKQEISNLGIDDFVTKSSIHSGEAFICSEYKKNTNKLMFNLMGSEVDCTKKLLEINDNYQTEILCSEATWILADSYENVNKIVTRKLDKIKFNENLPITIYNIIEAKENITPLQEQQIELFNQAMEEYHKKKYLEAGKKFVFASTLNSLFDKTSIVMAERCKNIIESDEQNINNFGI